MIFVLIFADNFTTYYWISNVNTNEELSIYEAISRIYKGVYK